MNELKFSDKGANANFSVASKVGLGRWEIGPVFGMRMIYADSLRASPPIAPDLAPFFNRLRYFGVQVSYELFRINTRTTLLPFIEAG